MSDALIFGINCVTFAFLLMTNLQLPRDRVKDVLAAVSAVGLIVSGGFLIYVVAT